MQVARFNLLSGGNFHTQGFTSKWWTLDCVCQVERLMARDGCSRELAGSKVAAQMPLDAKRAKSQHIIDNSGSWEETHAQVPGPTCLYARASPAFLHASLWHGPT